MTTANASKEFIRIVRRIKALRLRGKDAVDRMQELEKGRMVRVYCVQHGEAWNLQLHAPLGVGGFGGKDGRDFLIATASLDREDMTALRDALDEHLADS